VKTLPSIFALAALLAIGAASLAQEPTGNISAERHPNLAAAQRMIRNAYDKITAAQHANDWDMQGHAKKAQQLLKEASTELQAAAQDDNRRTH
jgi:hypothetical protein